jgi:hypothetical protein
MLLPAGTLYCGTAKHHSVGEVQSAYQPILPDGSAIGKRGGGHSSPG